METGIIIAFGFWGLNEGSTTMTKIAFCILTPVIGFGFWGLVDFHQMGKWAEPLRCTQEILISALAAFLLYQAGAFLYSYILILLSILYHLLIYVNGERLLKKKTAIQ
jgi:hypothetical protein